MNDEIFYEEHTRGTLDLHVRVDRRFRGRQGQSQTRKRDVCVGRDGEWQRG
jgi:hypothetical protein